MPDVPIDPKQFGKWREEFPEMLVLNETSSMIHRAGCGHFEFKPDEKIDFAPKWVSMDIAELVSRAEKLGKKKVLYCQSCDPGASR